MGQEKRIDNLLELERYEIPRWPIWWDPIPPWLKLDEKLQRQFVQMEIKFQLKELELMQNKLQEFSKMTGMG